MAETRPRRRSVNFDLFTIVKNYFKESSKEEIRFDLVVPFIISSFTVVLLYVSDLNMLKVLEDVNSIIIDVMAILAGFNTASVSIIASSNPVALVEDMSNQGRHGEGRKLLNSLTSYFSYAIILQLFILIVSIVASIVLKFFEFETFKSGIYLYMSLSGVFILWFTLVLNSLFITMRNASILHNFIMFLAKNR